MYWAKQYPKKLKRNCGQMSKYPTDNMGAGPLYPNGYPHVETTEPTGRL